MKNALLRAFVLVLTIAGIGSTVNAKITKGKSITVSGPSHNIIPNCSPGDPNKCGMD